jgi:hypothetical protein
MLSTDTIIAAASLVTSIASCWIAQTAKVSADHSLALSQQVAARDREEWRRKLWAELYLKADEAYDLLDAFQVNHKGVPITAAFYKEKNDLMMLLRRVNSMAIVFPKSLVMEKFFDITGGLAKNDDLLSKDKLDEFFDALENVRHEARIQDPELATVKPVS